MLGPVGLGVGLVRAGAPVVQQRHRDRGRHRELWRQLPEAADLLALRLSAGLPVAAAVATVSGAHDGPVGAALTRIDRRHREGQRFAQAVSAVLVEVSADLRPLLTTIGAAHVDGGPVVESLRRLAADHREQRRRHGEAEARRVPVMLLFPLVCCILPAFVLIALVPLVAGSVGELSFP